MPDESRPGAGPGAVPLDRDPTLTSPVLADPAGNGGHHRARQGLAAALITLLLALVGAADAAYLTALKQSKDLVGVADSPLCRRFSATGCDVALSSPVADVFGIPVATFALAAYSALVALALVRLRQGWRAAPGPSDSDSSDAHTRATVTPAEGVSAGLVLGAVGWSAFLGTYSATTGQWCPACVLLYGVNTLLFVTHWGSTRRLVFGLGTREKVAVIRSRTALWTVAGILVVGGALEAFSAWRLSKLLPLRQKFDREQVDKALASGLVAFDELNAGAVGPAHAALKITKFSDLECPHCRKYFLAIEAMRVSAQPAIQVSFRHFPLSNECNRFIPSRFHEAACSGARAAICAEAQGKLFEFAEAAFNAQPGLDAAQIASIGAALGFDPEHFAACQAAPSTTRRLERDILLARMVGVEGTPASVVNGLFFEGGFGTHSLAWLAESLPQRLSPPPPPSPVLSAFETMVASPGPKPLASPRALGRGKTDVEVVVAPDVSSEPLLGLVALTAQLPDLVTLHLRVSGEGPLARRLVCALAGPSEPPGSAPAEAPPPRASGLDARVSALALIAAAAPRAVKEGEKTADAPLPLASLDEQLPELAQCAEAPRAATLLAGDAGAISALGRAALTVGGHPLVLPANIPVRSGLVEQAVAAFLLWGGETPPANGSASAPKDARSP